MALDYVGVVRTEADRCVRLLRESGHDRPVPHLPGWTVGDVGAHLAGDLRWATEVIRSRRQPRAGISPVEATGPALADELARQAEAMVEALEQAAAAADEPCPNFAEGRRGRLGWWPRHQAFETTVHRWDLEPLAGPHHPVEPSLAADGVDELFRVYTARYGPHPLTSPLTVRCLGIDAGWRISPRGKSGRVGIEQVTGLDRADLEGEPEPLLLTLWHRLTPDAAGLAIRGDEAAVLAFLAGPLTA